MPSAQVFLCGQFDGSHLWLQWEDISQEVGYHVQLRVRSGNAAIWGPWTDIQAKKTKRRTWASIAVNKFGYQVQARVAVAGSAVPLWVMAEEVTFAESSAPFEFTGKRRQRFIAGREFHCFVDGAACHYKLQEDVEFGPEPAKATMLSSVASAWSQLDEKNQFVVHLPGGVVLRNTGPSENDVTPTGRDYTVLSGQKRKAPVRLILRKRVG